jgi:molybdopterin/thiamine biosynthesis adenylyltransferase
MELMRIKNAIDIQKTQNATVGVVGAGGNAGLICDLARCGVQHFVVIDFDRVDRTNIARQAHALNAIGTYKVDAIAAMVRAINPEAEVLGVVRDFTTLTDDEIDALFGDCDLMIFTTDSFKAQARGNQVALRLGIPAIWIGLYGGGRAGEIILWHSEIASCFRCLCSSRYRAQEQAAAKGISLDPGSDGATIFDIHCLDSIAGEIALGLLTRGSDNRFGRLVAQLADRNFLQIVLDPTWTWNGRNIIREQLGVPDDRDTFFSWITIARRDPTSGQPCPDCVKYRGRAPALPAAGDALPV